MILSKAYDVIFVPLQFFFYKSRLKPINVIFNSMIFSIRKPIGGKRSKFIFSFMTTKARSSGKGCFLISEGLKYKKSYVDEMYFFLTELFTVSESKGKKNTRSHYCLPLRLVRKKIF